MRLKRKLAIILAIILLRQSRPDFQTNILRLFDSDRIINFYGVKIESCIAGFFACGGSRSDKYFSATVRFRRSIIPLRKMQRNPRKGIMAGDLEFACHCCIHDNRMFAKRAFYCLRERNITDYLYNPEQPSRSHGTVERDGLVWTSVRDVPECR